ncbi:hypothetical protein M405DRAFT_777237 [Rhizopogon salebrosus TDB-379]|nr:hypothetical protein M405DRAFT_777237 [Rhizopogon salebrosus TDB-379]
MNATNSTSIASPGESAFDPYVIIGPVVLGALVNASFFGCLVIQTYFYYANFAKDHRTIKLMVVVVFAMQIAHLICVSATLWNMAVSAYDDPSKLQVFPLATDATILFTCITGGIVELYFSFRLWKLSKGLILPLFSLALCLVAQCLSLVIAVEAFSMTSVAEFAVDQSTIITVSLTSRAVYDLITAMGLVWYLMKQRSTALSRSIIDRLVLWTVETGLVTSLVAILFVSFFIAMKESYIWVGFYSIIANVNANSLLASLNGRLVVRNMANEALQRQALISLAEGQRKPQSVVMNVMRTVETPSQKYDELA